MRRLVQRLEQEERATALGVSECRRALAEARWWIERQRETEADETD